MFHGLEVQQVLNGGKAFLVWGWPTPIRAGARTELPPDPGKPTYGPAAKAEARRLLREAKRAKVNLGPITKRNLFKVIHGQRPLSYSLWYGTQAYVRRVSSEREREQDLRENPMAVDLTGLLAHQGTGLVWREHRPALMNPDYDPTAKGERLPTRPRYNFGSDTQSKQIWGRRRAAP